MVLSGRFRHKIVAIAYASSRLKCFQTYGCGVAWRGRDTNPGEMSPSQKDIFQLYDVQREFGEQDQQASDIEEEKEFRQIQAQSLLDHEMAEMSPVDNMSYLLSQMHFDESVESIADSDLENGEIRKLLTSHCMPKEFLGNQMQWSFRRERGKCTNVSFIRRSENFRETGCIVFTKSYWTEKPNVELCVRKHQSVSFEWNSAGRQWRSLAESGKIRSSQKRTSCRVTQ